MRICCYPRQTLQSDAEACQAAVKAAEMIRAAAASNMTVDEAALQQAMLEQQRALKEASEVWLCARAHY